MLRICAMKKPPELPQAAPYSAVALSRGLQIADCKIHEWVVALQCPLGVDHLLDVVAGLGKLGRLEGAQREDGPASRIDTEHVTITLMAAIDDLVDAKVTNINLDRGGHFLFLCHDALFCAAIKGREHRAQRSRDIQRQVFASPVLPRCLCS